jgi:YggT family protein
MTLSSLVITLAQLLTLAILVRSVLSWFPTSRTLAPVVNLLDDVTSPVITPIRRRLPTFGGLDLSPMLAILLIWAAESVLLSVLGGH